MCGSLADSVKRLACFDAVAGRLQGAADTAAKAKLAPAPTAATIPTAQSPFAQGTWQTTVTASKIDDTSTVIAMLTSKEQIYVRYSTYQPGIVIRCLESTTVFYLDLGGAFVADSGSYGKVTLRVDKKPAVEKSLRATTDNRGLGLWDGSVSIPFIRTLLDGQVLVARVTPYGESAVTMEFDLRGIRPAVEQVAKACHWTL